MNFANPSEALALASEFRRAPFGHHSPNLQKLLRMFRSLPIAGKHALFSIRPNRSWMLVTLTGIPGRPMTKHEDIIFEDLAEAEWYVFRRRWRQHFGTELPDGAEA
ncbi:ABC transporter permease [Mesorhizobium sp. M0968]|uniref:ABC transporter permease n=1 Tax=Mesorhizobium sp. M0968 TaxID=2957037 RepID=UPI003339A492